MHLIVLKMTSLIMENHGIVFLNFCGNPGSISTFQSICFMQFDCYYTHNRDYFVCICICCLSKLVMSFKELLCLFSSITGFAKA